MAVSTTLIRLVSDLVADDARQVGPGVLERWIAEAVGGTYTRDRPRVYYVDLTPSGTNQIALPTAVLTALLDWGDPASFISSLQYPIQRPRTDLPSDAAYLYPEGVEAAQVTHLEFADFVPDSATSNVRMRFNRRHRAGLSEPTGLTLTVVNPAASTVGYRVAAVDATGTSLACDEVLATTAPAVLSGTDYVTLSWALVTDATSYRVYRTTGGASQGLIGSPSTLTLNDTGLAATTTSTIPQKATAETTVPPHHRQAVAHLAASLLFARLAALKAGATSSGLHATAVGWQGMKDAYISLAEYHFKLYVGLLRPSEDEIEAGQASSYVWPLSSSRSPHLMRMYNDRLVQRMRGR